MTETTGTGKNVEKAIEDALSRLNTSRDNVDIKILETGGLFKKAQVLVSLSDEYLQTIKPKERKQEERKSEEKPAKKPREEKVEPEQVQPAKIQSVKKDEKEHVKKEQVKNEVKQQREQNSTEENELQKGKEFLENFLKVVDVEGVVDAFEDEDEIFYTVMGEKVSQLIGYRGECLNSLQFLVTVINGKNNRKNKHVRLDIDNYRQKRKETLEMLARRVAKKVLKTGHQTRLEPMTAYERRIIHTTVQEFEGLTSLSRGEEPHRYLIIKPKEDSKITDNRPTDDTPADDNQE